MSRLLFVLILIFALRGHTQEKRTCDWQGVPQDSNGCVDFFWYNLADKYSCQNMPKCFTLPIKESGKKEPFQSEDPEERRKIIPILDSSAVALLKNSNIKGLKIIFYNKTGKLSKDFQKEAEKYLLDKGVKAEQFIIEIR